MNWSLIGSGLRLLFLLRVPLLALLMLGTLGPVSQFTSASSLLRNLFDQQDDAGSIWLNMFAVAFAAFLLAFTAIATLNLVLLYGALRFSEDLGIQFAPAVAKPNLILRQRRPDLTFVAGTLAACSLVVSAILRTGGQYVVRSVSAALAAFVCVTALALLAKIVQLALTDPRVTAYPPPLLIFPAYRWRWLVRRLDRIYAWPGQTSPSRAALLLVQLKHGTGGWLQRPYRVVNNAAQGYLIAVTTDNGGTRLKLRSGHTFALTLALLTLFVYVVIGYNKFFITAAPATLPALAYVLLFLTVLCWVLAGLAFFFDRYRFPLTGVFLCFALLTSSDSRSDHFFRVETARGVPKLSSFDYARVLTPAEYLAARSNDPSHRRTILVATPGGGIQAAAWTAQVLQQLDQRFPASEGYAGFRDSVALISSVSGGSLGSMIYAASFAGNVKPNCVAVNARTSAIDEVAWGWTAPDFWRAAIPWFGPNPTTDRGWALEQKWGVVNGLNPQPACSFCKTAADAACVGTYSAGKAKPDGNDTFLSDWARQGIRVPALIFNSMLVERGQHVVFTTTHFPKRQDARGIVNFYDLYRDVQEPFDIRVNTAARLSASFPYVAPAARPNLRSATSPDFHFVDGGYYDNLGVDALAGWLSEAYGGGGEAFGRNAREVLILQIRHFNPAAAAGGSRQGWSFQLFAPLKALLAMWNYAPVQRDGNELKLLMGNVGLLRSGLHVRTAVIPYCGLDYGGTLDARRAFNACVTSAGGNWATDKGSALGVTLAQSPSAQKRVNCADQPLSWKLTLDQKGCIEDTWNAWAANDPTGALNTIAEFLRSDD